MESPITREIAAAIEERIQWLDLEIDAALGSAADLPLYRMARYHLGWSDDQFQPFGVAERRKYGGKRLRGVLCILACEAAGGDGRLAAPAGAAIELVHNFSLVHDDIEDNDAERRHRPTVWKLWGVPHGINVGSSMQAMVNVAALCLKGRTSPERVVEVMSTLTDAIVRMTEGQYLDMAAQDAHEMSLPDYFRMTGGKTAALVRAALEVGALLGTEDRERVRLLGDFGERFGLAFQARDDFLGVWGEPSLTGKPVGSDILQGKRSLPMVHALASAAAECEAGRRLRDALAARDVPAVMGFLEASGTRRFVEERVDEHTQASLQALSDARPEAPYGAALRAIAEYALARES